MKAFENYHPFVLLLYFGLVLVISMFVWNPVIQLLALFGGICFGFMLIPAKTLLKSLLLDFALLLLIALTNPFFSHNGMTPLFYLNGSPITLEALIYGGCMGLMIVGVLLWCRCCQEILTTDKFLFLFGRLIPKLSLVLSMTLRFIPLLKRQMHHVSRAQKTMGLAASGGYLQRVKHALQVLSALVSWSLENAIETAASMKARGYGLPGRSQFSMYRFRFQDSILLAGCLVLAGITLTGVGVDAVSFQFYPTISPVTQTASAWSVYLSFGLLVFLPFILEILENIRWNYCRSKI